MPDSRITPYGSWKSPITSDLIVSGSIGLSQPLMDGSDLYWIEMRPTEGGRSVIVKRDASGVLTDVILSPSTRGLACMSTVVETIRSEMAKFTFPIFRTSAFTQRSPERRRSRLLPSPICVTPMRS